jgi:EamA domain-containing membrane protein RarD
MITKEYKERLQGFFFNIPATLKETSIWFISSYLISIINILIIWGMRKNFGLDLNIINIILVTNAGFLTSVFLLLYLSDKKRKTIFTLAIIIYVITITLFSISIVQIESQTDIFTYEIYKISAIVLFGLSILLGLISKYDEVEAMSKLRAKKAKTIKSTTIGNTEIKL